MSTCVRMPPLQTLAQRDAALDRLKGRLGAGSFTFGTLEGDHLPGSTPPTQKPSRGTQQHSEGSSEISQTLTAPPRLSWAAEAPTCLAVVESLWNTPAKGMRTQQQRLCWLVETRGCMEDMVGGAQRGRRAEPAKEHPGAQARVTHRDVTCCCTNSRMLNPGGSWAAAAGRERPG